MKILRWVLYLLPLSLCALGIFMCAASMIDFQELQAQMEKQTGDHTKEMDNTMAELKDDPLAAVVVLPIIMTFVFTKSIAEGLGVAMGMLLCSIIFLAGAGSFLIGLMLATISKNSPLELRRAGILLNGLLLVIAGAIYACGYFA